MKRMVIPEIIITNHCQIEGTIMCEIGNKIGNVTAVKSKNWCAIAYIEDSRKVNNVEFIEPNKIPGIKCMNLAHVRLSSIANEPTIMMINNHP